MSNNFNEESTGTQFFWQLPRKLNTASGQTPHIMFINSNPKLLYKASGQTLHTGDSKTSRARLIVGIGKCRNRNFIGLAWYV